MSKRNAKPNRHYQSDNDADGDCGWNGDTESNLRANIVRGNAKWISRSSTERKYSHRFGQRRLRRRRNDGYGKRKFCGFGSKCDRSPHSRSGSAGNDCAAYNYS